MGRHVSGDSIGNKRSLSGREKSIKLIQKIEDDLPAINIEKRNSILSLSYQLNIPRSTAHYDVSEGYIKCINKKVKPCLNMKQKINRVKFSFQTSTYLTKCSFRLIILFTSMRNGSTLTRYQGRSTNTTEKKPIRRCSNKCFIRKLMFPIAVDQPSQDHGRKVLLDGKLGCWTLTEVAPCSSNRKNRPKGDMVIK